MASVGISPPGPHVDRGRIATQRQKQYRNTTPLKPPDYTTTHQRRSAAEKKRARACSVAQVGSLAQGLLCRSSLDGGAILFHRLPRALLGAGDYLRLATRADTPPCFRGRNARRGGRRAARIRRSAIGHRRSTKREVRDQRHWGPQNRPESNTPLNGMMDMEDRMKCANRMFVRKVKQSPFGRGFFRTTITPKPPSSWAGSLWNGHDLALGVGSLRRELGWRVRSCCADGRLRPLDPSSRRAPSLGASG